MKLSGIAPPAETLLHDGIALAADGAAVIRDADGVAAMGYGTLALSGEIRASASNGRRRRMNSSRRKSSNLIFAISILY